MRNRTDAGVLFLCIVLLFCLAVAAWGEELTLAAYRHIRYSENFAQDFREAVESAAEELRELGCVHATILAYSDVSEPSRVLVEATCTKFAEKEKKT